MDYMASEASLTSKGRRRRIWSYILFLFILLLFVSASTYSYILYFWPNSAHVADPFQGNKRPIFYQGKELSLPADGTNEGLRLPLPVVQSLIDPSVRNEDSSQSIIITTQDKVLRLKTEQLSAMLNEKPISLKFPVSKVGDTLYVPIDTLKSFYSIDISESDKTGAVLIRKAGDAVQWGKLSAKLKKRGKSIPIRDKPTVKAPIVADVAPDERVMIWGEENGWYRVQKQDGYLGYVAKKDMELDNVEVMPVPPLKASFVPWKPTGGMVDLTWQQVTGVKPIDTSKIGPMPGLNVISPQWFHLNDGEGNLKNYGDAAFAKWAHDRGYQLWALFSNSFDPKITTDALGSYDTRMKMIKQLIVYAQMYGIEGINIDFENVNLKDKANMVQFVREAVPMLHEQGLVVSIDVTVKDGSETYSQFMDRQAIGAVVDYMMIMTYDEHWATSQTAGSVSSLPWVEKGIAQIMKEDAVPASKIIMGIPFYTRIWTEEQKDGKTQVTSKAVSMDTVQKLIKDKNLTPVFAADTGQNYVEYTEDGKRNRIWIEDEASIKSRVELAKKLGLAGVASWSRAFETDNIWPAIEDTLEQRP